jgi:hypothetical protein
MFDTVAGGLGAQGGTSVAGGNPLQAKPGTSKPSGPLGAAGGAGGGGGGGGRRGSAGGVGGAGAVVIIEYA